MKGRIPRELQILLQEPSPVGRSLLIKGPTGSGKTTFVIQVAEALHKECIVGWSYVNIVTSERALFRRHAKLRTDFALVGFGLRVDQLPSSRDVPRTGLRRLSEYIRAGTDGPRILHQLRSFESETGEREASSEEGCGGPPYPGGPEVGIVPVPWKKSKERIPEPPQSEDESDLPELERTWEYVERCRGLPALLIVDSLDALARHYGVPALRLHEALCEDLIETGLADVIYVWENPGRTPLDARVDGIVALEQRDDRGQRLGLLTIEQVRGRGIRQHRYTFELHNGRLWTSPSDEELVEALLRGWRGLPSSSYGGPGDLLADRRQFP